jgi:tripartite-type tricarboxylate transporter receptor subunit TctC
VLAAAALAAGAPTGTQAADSYFKGRTVKLLVGFGPGGGVDLNARLFAQYLPDKIAGKPNVIVENMAGAFAIKAHNTIYEGTKGDGETVLFGPWFPIAQILESPGIRFEYQKFSLIAAFSSAGFLTYVRNDAVPGGFTRSTDILKAQNLRFAGLAPTATFDLLGRLPLDLFDIRYTYITGYRGSSDINPAVMKDEASIAVDSVNAYRAMIEPVNVKQGISRPLWAIPVRGEDGKWKRNPALPEVPTVNEVYKEAFGKEPSGVKWQTLELNMDLLAGLSQLILGPPKMNEAAQAELRQGFYAVLADKTFQDDATKRFGTGLPAIPPDRAAKIIASLSSIDPAQLAYLKQHVAAGSKVKQ